VSELNGESNIFFLSYGESNREKNWFKLKEKQSKARLIHGIKGLALAHLTCAKLSQTEFFFVVNADNEILDDFHFQLPQAFFYLSHSKTSAFDTIKKQNDSIQRTFKSKVYCWRSLNPVNGLIYGFGGVKLFPRSLFLSHSSSFVDLSTSFKGKYQVVQELASITRFNVSPLEAWRGAFRECVKLASQCINNQKSKETHERLAVWCEKGEDKAFGKYVLRGAKRGRDYGLKNKNNRKALSKINDFDWLNKIFKQDFGN